MKKKITISILTLFLYLSLIMAMAVPSFAETTDSGSQTIQTVEQLKAEISVCMEDGEMTAAEKRALLAQTTGEATADLISEKLDTAVDVLNGNEDTKMQCLLSGSTYVVKEYDLGDNCVLRVELEDRAEGNDNNNGIALMPLATSGSSEMWKEYGNRYFTATATVDCKVGSATLSLENHYKLSSSGIDEVKGVSDGTLKNVVGTITRKSPQITDSAARTPGASDVNMYCEYTVKINDGNLTDTKNYRLNTAVKYLSHDKTGKRIKVGHTWNLTKVS